MTLDGPLFCIGDATITLWLLIQFVSILAFTWILAAVVRFQVRKLGGKQHRISSAGMYALGRLSFYLIIIIGIMSAFNAVGIKFTTFTVIAGALSVGIGFGMQTVFNNFVSGVILLVEKNIRIGDTICIDGKNEGKVKAIYVRTTIVEMADGKTLLIPNSDLVSKQVILARRQ